MKQSEYVAVIDEFSDAVYDLAEGAPPAKNRRVKKALGNLITMLASQATAQSLGAFGLLLAKLERTEARLDADEDEIAQLRADVDAVLPLEAREVEA
jgi:hypothetical protein